MIDDDIELHSVHRTDLCICCTYCECLCAGFDNRRCWNAFNKTVCSTEFEVFMIELSVFQRFYHKSNCLFECNAMQCFTWITVNKFPLHTERLSNGSNRLLLQLISNLFIGEMGIFSCARLSVSMSNKFHLWSPIFGWKE